uniref:Uncharacterized protein n=1 Tax=Arundo donax TaxID=35708 RepID=A0A0A9AHH1_ARUDO
MMSFNLSYPSRLVFTIDILFACMFAHCCLWNGLSCFSHLSSNSCRVFGYSS